MIRSKPLWVTGVLVIIFVMVTIAGQLMARHGASLAFQPVEPLPGTAVPLAQSSNAPFPDRETSRLMDALIDPNTPQGSRLRTILAAHDIRFIAVLIEMLRASQIGLVKTIDDAAVVEALEQLSGHQFGADWPAWVEWYGTSLLVPPPGFTGWKGRLLSRIDPRFGEFLIEGAPSQIRVEEIQWGGVVVDGILALDNPPMIQAIAATYLTPQEPVFGLSVNGDARAYPLRILDWHEMVNDVVGGTPVSLAYCTLCGTGIAYAGHASHGRTYTFGSSGLLYRSNKLMYDRQTRTLWNQLTGEPVLGALAGTTIRLSLVPVVLASWRDWRNEHPTTKVIDINTGYERTYAPGVPYGQYFSSPNTMFPVWRRSKALPAKARVYTLRLDGVPKAYPIEVLAARRVVNDVVGHTSVVLVATRGIVSVRGRREAGVVDRVRAGNVTYSAGGEVRAYRRGVERFHPGEDANTILDSGGRRWHITENALVAATGARAPRINGFLAYWFGWYEFFPQTLVYPP